MITLSGFHCTVECWEQGQVTQPRTGFMDDQVERLNGLKLNRFVD